jgi:two-component system response regulator AtoC
MALVSHRWTGNVRELKNVVERGVLIGEGPTLTPGNLGLDHTLDGNPRQLEHRTVPWEFAPIPPEGIDLSALEKAMERFYIETALTMAGGNESQAARLLHLNHHTFRYRRKKILSELRS